MYVLASLAACIIFSLTVSAHVTCAVNARGDCGRPLNVVAFSGSLRKASVNQGLLRFAQSVGAKYDLNITIISTQLPLYNGDVEAAGMPDEVRAFRDAVEGADCLLLGVEEYNFSFSGVMKNALDWASRLIEGKRPLVGKLAAFMSGGGGMGGSRAQYHLRQVFIELGGQVFGKPEVTVRRWPQGQPEPFDAEGNVTSDAVKANIEALLAGYSKWVKTWKAGEEVIAASSAVSTPATA